MTSEIIWQIEQAKNGEKTLLMNKHYLYSKYNPREGVARWVEAEVRKADSYLLIGVGLGYHLHCLVNKGFKKHIYVYCFNQAEFDLFKAYNINNDWWVNEKVSFIFDFEKINFKTDVQLLLPNQVVKALGVNHPLHQGLEYAKMNLLSFKKYGAIMEENFHENLLRNDHSIVQFEENKTKISCLVAAGPSLNETVEWIKGLESKIDIYVVGAALKVLLMNQIKPKGIVLTDANEITKIQFEGVSFEGELYYLSTANYKTVANYKGNKKIIFQKDYSLAKQHAKEYGLPLIETGGSVGTTCFSLLQFLGYETIVLFGQDLGFIGNKTHARLSPSISEIDSNTSLRTVKANDGSNIFTTPSLQSFQFWYNNKMKITKAKVYNTAKKGAKIYNVPLIDKKEFEILVKKFQG